MAVLSRVRPRAVDQQGATTLEDESRMLDMESKVRSLRKGHCFCFTQHTTVFLLYFVLGDPLKHTVERTISLQKQTAPGGLGGAAKGTGY